MVESRDVITPLLPPGAWHPSVSIFWATHTTHANTYMPTDKQTSRAVCQQGSAHQALGRCPRGCTIHSDNDLDDEEESYLPSPHTHTHTTPDPHPSILAANTFIISDQGVFG